MNANDFNIKSFHKMLFIFNAVLNGWSVSYRNNTFIFRKNTKKIERKYLDEDYLRHFINDNTDPDSLLN